MMLRNRSRAVTKQSLMGEQSPKQNFTTTIPSLFGSPNYRDFHFTSKKCLNGNEALISPTSILDTRALSPFGNPFSYDNKNNKASSSSWDKVDSKIIGLALVGALKDESFNQNSDNKLCNRKVLFGTELRVKIPPMPPTSTFDSKTDFVGNKTKGSQKCSRDWESTESNNELMIRTAKRHGHVHSTESSVLSLSEMELSEEYTCVISHGPNPRTTHIFDNCVVEMESYCYVPNSHSSMNFLNFCYTCKNHLEHTKDIFIYR